MIREIAQLVIDPAKEAEFLEAVGRAVPIFQAAGGCLGMSLERVIETPGLYRLHVLWETLEAHTEGFRTSDGFQQWRALAGPFFTQAPRVDHSEPVVTGFGS
ncbi:antibiotic biosynthesis monooxygenase [Pseudooceanicola sediminis]|uniref:Antibiotic biosynthesis monooxygenase n=1 Tax=Pseudooceanicola sediminis TaxID=2211117 RepID=A0A399J4H9_9RHOB|nr:antibiotic biosynthesis monooxygenase family protein [Pseudooceanicola sediminis]KAA2315520.1 antibiotic biosynthesis monooxygenase [Puniceibacterium sp. HSS470]RII40275.1 antibiotic biosynthesis monooxygenase [Pseudooceanicola sediminis]|tara:strand:- start:76698 stop:77003 length:306 start_codon:yes stop_codon:yes gene_type:complete